ncbi:type-F conjugative transfer system secretin TraK [Escherichia coli]|nr:type-F conjugative transfer system secretin TraK [Escherichia coli]EFB3628193.1 type-F conjugative transfer system secretin TraK [Escherichia coli]EFD4880615.1 type-F conjugative transfer system secretin TraK [Escherichia coli]EFE8272964.1 type-F conjugative transfer system secretin TraK [Escherichia coli]EFH3341751.1 type-F conjugative transfer system secretin TraK [Escherichia coli]
MRKNNTAIIFGSLFFSCSVMAANGTLAPTVVPMVNGGQASIAISNTSPNLFTVPGDRIIAVNSLDGALTNNEQTASGGVVVATVNKKPFTFILETERGLNLSIQAVPREGAGRTIQLVSDLRGTGEEAGAWETSTPYESLLVTISQAVRGGKLPAGWYQVPVTKETLQAPAGLSSVADAVWTGNHLKMVRFMRLTEDVPDARQELLNRLLSGKKLTGRDEKDIRRLWQEKVDAMQESATRQREQDTIRKFTEEKKSE